MGVVSDYLQTTSEPQKTTLVHISEVIRADCPDATEVITYGMPGYKYKGKYLIAFSAFKDHLSIFPGSGAIEAYAQELAKFKTSKGTIQFSPESPLSDELLKKIIAHRINDISSGLR